jgi:RNA polymerase sigma-70 factor (ECF subfamily)
MNASWRGQSEATAPSFEESFRRLFQAQYPSLFRYLQRLTGDVDAAEDFAQEVFVRLYQRGSLPDDARAWMAAVAHNLLRDENRTAKRRLQLMQARPLGLQGTSPRTADEKLLADERRKAVRTVLDKLNERDRRMLLLRHSGYSYREIAHAVGVSETSVGTLLLRATGAFRTAFQAIES